MPKRFQDPVLVPTTVLDGLETVRESSDTNMQDPSRAKYLAARLGYPETAAWIQEHPRDYQEGVFRGFVGNPKAAVAVLGPRESAVSPSGARGGAAVPPEPREEDPEMVSAVSMEEGEGVETPLKQAHRRPWWRRMFSP